jgi:cytochrome c peroxidase
MKRRTGSSFLPFTLTALLFLGGGCAMEVEGEDELEPGLDEVESGGGVVEGGVLFNLERFGGNDRRCASCHPVALGQSGTLNPAQVQLRFKLNPDFDLFRHDAADTIGGTTFERIKQHATILVEKDLPANVSIAGSSARSVLLPRGIPTVRNTPALDPVLMYDGREPDLQEQARNAIIRHAQTDDVTDAQLDAIAAFQRELFNRNNLRDFARNGTPVRLPYGSTDSQRRGRRWFIDDDKVDAGDVGESKFNVCGFCHSGPMLNELSGFFVANVSPPGFVEGDRFFTVLVSEFNAMGNPVYDFEFTMPDGSVVVMPSPDPGTSLVNGEPPIVGNGFFKIPTVWGAKDTAPFFHDNSSKTLTDLMNHYDDAIFILSETDNPETTLGQVDLSEQDKADIIAYMLLL